MYNLNKSIKIDPQFTAQEWELYTVTMECSRVALVLNSNLKKLVNAGNSMEIVEKKMHELMYRYSSYGAFDTEPRWLLSAILQEVYNP